MQSALYLGSLSHRRFAPRGHRFGYRLFMLWLDLDELDAVFRGRWLWSTRRPALARFDRRDHLGEHSVPLERAVRDLVEARTGRRPAGPIRLLAHLRYFGYCFNPVSFFYCYASGGERIEAIVAEVNNTPWGERHCYVLDATALPARAAVMRFRLGKALHVSPFMPMDQVYDWRFSAPGERLAVHTALHAASGSGGKVFDATLALRRVPISGASLAGVLVLFPLVTLKVIAAIYWQALRLWAKGIPFHHHPGAGASPSSAAAGERASARATEPL
ncbi:MAG TPA: DUF1365 domain-containing protein [Burkholderiales bacterium]|nr:DUF1365 domain-containing protein [Burkholderiales bacterium]